MSDSVATSLGVLSAMITPAVLISACGTLILSTSVRLGRVVDRVRRLSEQFEALAKPEQSADLLTERRALIFDQLDRLTSRARLLQRAMTIFYLALGLFVLTSVAIGVVTLSTTRYPWVPVLLGLLGACFLFYGSVLLVLEARLAMGTIRAEMDFLWRLGQHYAPADLVGRPRARRRRGDEAVERPAGMP